MPNTNKVFNIIIKLTKEGGADKEVVRGLSDIKSAFVTGAAMAGVFVASYYAVDKILASTVGTLITATTAVEGFRHETGMTAEDSSRLLEVMKDLEISTGDVETAFKFAEKNGFAPTIASLEAMQQQYLTLAPGMDRVQFLVKEFGKSGLNLQKFFETGDAAKRLEEVNAALLISDEEIKNVQVYKDQLDTIGDTWQGLKLNAGKVTLPILIEILTDASNFFKGGELRTSMQQLNTQLIQGSSSADEYNRKWKSVFDNFGTSLAMVATGVQDWQVYGNTLDQTRGMLSETEFATLKLTLQLNAESDKLDAVHGSIGRVIPKLDELNQSTSDYTNLLSGTVKSLNDIGVAALIAELSLDGTFTAEDAQQVLNYQNSLGLVTSEEYKARQAAIDMQTAIDALHDKGITVTTTWLNYYIESQAPKSPYGRGSGTLVQQKASGGPLAPIDEVGEQGTEGIINGVVIPHNIWMQLKRWLKPGRRLGGGGTLAHLLEEPALPSTDWANSTVSPTGPTPLWIPQNDKDLNNLIEHNWYMPSGSSGGSTSTIPMLQATQTVSAASASISSSGERTAQATIANAAQNNASNAAILAKLNDIDLRLSQFPTAIAAAVAKIVPS